MQHWRRSENTSEFTKYLQTDLHLFHVITDGKMDRGRTGQLTVNKTGIEESTDLLFGW